MNYIDLFYSKIIKEARTGTINCYLNYNMLFETEIREDNVIYSANNEYDGVLIPRLIIKDKELFNKYLEEYVEIAKEFYKDREYDLNISSYEYKDVVKELELMIYLWSNATYEDFNNPIEFLKRRIEFFKNEINREYDLGYSSELKGQLNAYVEKDERHNETPYKFVATITSENGEVYEFPEIKFGISNDIVYIYAIQNKRRNDNEYSKKTNRILYKIGENFEENGNDDIRDITASFLVVINIFITLLEKEGYTNYSVPSILITRWNAKRIIATKKNYNLIHFDKEHEHLQSNLTNKLINTFLRLKYHFDNIEISSFPFETDSSLHFRVNGKMISNNRFLNNLSEEIYNNSDKLDR